MVYECENLYREPQLTSISCITFHCYLFLQWQAICQCLLPNAVFFSSQCRIFSLVMQSENANECNLIFVTCSNKTQKKSEMPIILLASKW